ncbi:hypothetical protein NADFUDRAFT_63217 [Nadsonia fulvescens var. elongata DSM 6958]|uniref:Cation efflux protein transmembrane domain-containing protein n=1 Tax=Nadsonia fulvescens var. elongata DSM 6958 TaxID=857566 RepID=A0A1E3PCM1_9ASCO|nr:hypothetical protein NADFUDRAFT_63217 [Nadsonia fulvescens var. elongata DSM 6958]
MRTSNLIGVGKSLVDWSQYRKSDIELSQIKKKSVRKFYEAQNELIDKYIDIDSLLDSGIPESLLKVYGEDLFESSASKNRRQGVPANIDSEFSDRSETAAVVMFAIYVNFIINIILLGGKVVVTLLTSSLSIMASLVDSVLDLMSTVIIWFSTRLVEKRDWKTKIIYPVGRNRLEPIGVLIFSIIIIFSFLQVAKSSLEKLLTSDPVETIQIGWASLLIMMFTILSKLFCYLWCKTIESSAVAALAQDAMTDIVFNSFSIIFPVVGHFFEIWWLDPLGALLLSFYIIWTWSETALEHINNLTGAQATTLERQPLLYLCSRFSSSVSYVTALNAYHSGDRIVAEVDLVLDTNNSLRDSHDIGEAVQYALEGLDWVERGFVHLDYRRGNYEGHMPR